MKSIIILGSGGVAEAVIWLIKTINNVKAEWNILGVVDKNAAEKSEFFGYPILGDDDWLLSYDRPVNLACAIGFPDVKRKVIDKYIHKDNVTFPSLISPMAIIAPYVSISEGCIIYPGTVLAPNVKLGKYVNINYNCTIGHDVIIGDYCCVNPGANISGHDQIGNGCLIGANSTIIQGIEIADDSTVGIGSVVFKSISEPKSTVIGNPGMITRKKV